MNLYFNTVKFAIVYMRSVRQWPIEIEIPKISCRRPRSVDDAERGHFAL